MAYILCSIYVSPHFAKAQGEYKIIGESQGMPSDMVYRITEDTTGRIWAATNNGVAIYDGNYMEVLGKKDGLPSDEIIYIGCDRAGGIWMEGMKDSLLYLYQGQMHKVAKPDPKGLLTYIIYTSAGEELYFIGDSCYVATGKAPYFTWTVYRWSAEKVRAITNPVSHLYSFELRKELGLQFGNLEFFRVNDDIIIKSANKEISGFRAINNYSEINEILDIHLPPDVIPRINKYHKTKDGSYWLTTSDRGMIYYPSFRWKFKNVHSPGKKYIDFIKGPGKAVELIYEYKMLSFLTEKREIKTLMGFRTNAARFNIQLGEYAFTLAGGTIYTNPREEIRTVINALDSIVIREKYGNNYNISDVKDTDLTDSTFWFATYYRLGTVKMLGNGICEITTYNPSARLVGIEIYQDRLYYSTTGGVFRWKDLRPERNPEKVLDGVSGKLVKYDSLLFILTTGNGLVVYDGKDTFSIPELSGLYIEDCDFRDSVMCLATTRGLYMMVWRNVRQKNYTIKRFSYDHGLQSNNVIRVLVNDTAMFAVTHKGLQYITLEDAFHTSFHIPAPYTRKIFINNTPVTQRDTFLLEWNQNNIRIDYSVVYYSRDKIYFRYRLDGWDSTWTSTDALTVNYTNLPPGKYTFEAYVCAEGHNTSEKPLVIHFIINVPFWQRLWFILVCIISGISLISLLVWSIIKIRLRNYRKKQEMMTQLQEFQLQALHSQVNPHFLYNIMNSLQYLIIRKDVVTSSEYLGKFSRLMRLMLETSKDKFVSLEREIDLISNYCSLEQFRFTDKFDYMIEVAPEIDISKTYIPSLMIQPYVENAILHGFSGITCKGMLSIRFSLHDNDLWIQIEDNGVGIRASKEKKRDQPGEFTSRGREITGSKIDLLNSLHKSNVQVHTEDMLPHGTRVTITINGWDHIPVD